MKPPLPWTNTVSSVTFMYCVTQFFDKVSRSFASAIGLAFEYQDILPTADGTEIYILKRTSHSPGSAGSASNFIRRTIEQIIGVQEGGPHYFKQAYHDFSNLIRSVVLSCDV